MVNIYWAGGEDSDCYQIGGGVVSTNTSRYRTSYARCGLETSGGANWQNYTSFTASTFWFSGRVFISNNNTSGSFLYYYRNSTNNIKLGIASTGSSATYKILKQTNSGTQTQLGSNFTMTFSNGASVDKLDVYVDYQASGTITVYLNGVQVFTYSGDVTTDGDTSLSYFTLGQPGSSPSCVWSEIILSDTDTRSWTLQTLAPTANGNTHDFDTGSPDASNVNEVSINYTTLDGSTTAGQIDQYTIPSIASGTWSIVAVGVSAIMQKGASGPSKMDLGVRSGSTDYWSSDKTLTTTWSNGANWWTTDPNTSSAWTALPSNIGLKSVT